MRMESKYSRLTVHPGSFRCRPQLLQLTTASFIRPLSAIAELSQEVEKTPLLVVPREKLAAPSHEMTSVEIRADVGRRHA